MKNWKKEEAIEALKDLINKISDVKNNKRNSEVQFRWLANTLRILEEIFGRKSRYYATISKLSWKETGDIIYQGYDIEGEIERRNNQAFQNQLDISKGLLWAAIDQLLQSDIEEVYEGENTPPEASELIQIINLGENKLRKLIRKRPENEREVQDKYEDLLIANDINYSREFPHIEYSSKQYIPDFSIEKLELAIEIKLCKNNEKKFIAEINDDILAYRTKFKNLIFLIYDLGQIRDVEMFKKSLETHQDVIIQIIKE